MSNCHNQVPCKVIDILECGERVYFTASYNIINVNIQDNNGTVMCEVIFNPLGYNILTFEFVYLVENSFPNTTFLKEKYTLASYSDRFMKKKTGQIIWEGIYPDTGSGGITNSKLEIFTSLGAIGFYKYIEKVIIDFSCPERRIYFIGPAQHLPKYSRNCN